MNDFELKRDLSRRNRNIPVIFISAKTDAAIHACALAEGVVTCLSKLFSEAALLDAVQSALRIKKEN